MATFSDCPSCLQGNHDGHVSQWGFRAPEVIDGDFCQCSGDCAERSKARFDEFWGSSKLVDLSNDLSASAPTLTVAEVLEQHHVTVTRELVQCEYDGWFAKRGEGARKAIADHHAQVLEQAGLVK